MMFCKLRVLLLIFQAGTWFFDILFLSYCSVSS